MGLIDWIDGHPNLAAWVQAIGAIIAIFAAFLISHFEVRATRKAAGEERRMKAQALALLLQPQLLAFKGELESDPLLRGRGVGPLEIAPLEPPKAIIDLADQLYLLGSPGGAILQMLGVLSAQRTLTSSILVDAEKRNKAFELSSQRQRIAIKNCDEALAGLQAIIDDGPHRP
jgi:hypothetical protein